MNYHGARQLKDGGWDWTTMNDGQIWTSGPCVDHPAGFHATKEEAERHFYDGEVARLRESSMVDQQVKCAICGAWTSKSLGTNYIGPVDLCDEHRNAEGFQQAYPFKPGMSIVASW